MDSSGENLTQIESEIREVVLAFLRSNGSDVSAIDVSEDLVKTGNLDSSGRNLDGVADDTTKPLGPALVSLLVCCQPLEILVEPHGYRDSHI